MLIAGRGNRYNRLVPALEQRRKARRVRDNEGIHISKTITIPRIKGICHGLVNGSPVAMVDYLYRIALPTQHPRMRRKGPVLHFMTKIGQNFFDVADYANVKVEIEELHDASSSWRVKYSRSFFKTGEGYTNEPTSGCRQRPICVGVSDCADLRHEPGKSILRKAGRSGIAHIRT